MTHWISLAAHAWEQLRLEVHLVIDNLFKSTACTKSVDKNRFLLAQPVRSTNSLFLVGWIEAEIIYDDTIRPLKVETKPAGSHGNQESMVITVPAVEGFCGIL